MSTEEGKHSPDALPRLTDIGQYRIARKIGQGGMGAVYEAERSGSFQQRVAIKLIKQGFESGPARARFLQERQVLASLQHPNIARLIDGGETTQFTPYIVLEFVDGIPIDQFCRQLARTAILEVFLKVCDAVEYAHRNLIIHRDLKPGNILVTPDGTPKLLDFGIAKLMDQSATLTQTGLAAFTPEYASPEQIVGGKVSTLADIYALGVLLYVLLTGRKPYGVETCSAIELGRRIVEDSPAPTGLGDELDDIILKAMHKEPGRRYQTVSELAADIGNYMEGRPVLARPDSAWYRANKYVRRYWLPIAATTLAAIALIAATGSAAWQTNRANRQFGSVRKLANKFLFDFDNEITNLPGSVKARQLVVSTALEYLSTMESEAASDPSLQWEIAVAYGKVAAVLGSMSRPSLQRREESVKAYEKGFTLMRSLADRGLLDQSQTKTFVEMLSECRSIVETLHQTPKAIALSREAVRYSRPLPELNRFRALGNLSIALASTGDIPGALEVFKETTAIASKAFEKDPSPENRQRLAQTFDAHGYALTLSADLDHAESVLRQGLPLLQQIQKERPQQITNRNLFVNLIHLGDLLAAGDRLSLGRIGEGVAFYEQALDLLATQQKADKMDKLAVHDMGLLHAKIASALLASDPKTALAHAREAVKLYEISTPQDRVYRAEPHIWEAAICRALADKVCAQRALNEARIILKGPGSSVEAFLAFEAAQQDAMVFPQAIALAEARYKNSPSPLTAFALTQVLSAAGPYNRPRINEVWMEQDKRFPGRFYIKARIDKSN